MSEPLPSRDNAYLQVLHPDLVFGNPRLFVLGFDEAAMLSDGFCQPLKIASMISSSDRNTEKPELRSVLEHSEDEGVYGNSTEGSEGRPRVGRI